MRIAVYLNGQWRGSSFECSKYLKEYFQHFEVDYYIHTSDYYFGKAIQLDFTKNGTNEFFRELSPTYHSREDIERIRNTYENVVYFEVDSKQKNEEITNLKENFSAFHNIYGGYKCNQYRKIYENFNGFRYDVIIKCRPDIIFQKGRHEEFKNLVNFISKNPNYFRSEHAIPRKNEIKPHTDYPMDIFQIGKNFFDVLDGWVVSTLNGKTTYISDLVMNMDYDIFNLGVPLIKSYIIRDLYKFNNLIELYYNDTINYESNTNGYTMCDLDEILYMGNNTRNNKKLFFEDWDIDFDSIISKCKKENNNTIYCLENDGLKILADEIERNWN